MNNKTNLLLHFMNRLATQTSPYLLQHASNPVDWFPWGSEAFAKAKAEDKMLLISVGYSSCHWCHVMEREAFSDLEVAQYMSENFVCIKVDREERPDVDQVYMNAIQIITRSGGWPLNCFALPDGRPVFGGTYFTCDSWLDVLISLNSTWKNEPQRVIEVAEELTQGIRQSELIAKKNVDTTFSRDILDEYILKWKKYFDEKYGSTKGAPKFPMPSSLNFLLTYASNFNDEHTKTFLKNTFDRMLNGGIYDHIAGGFFRYSVDERWEIPHFEKMLYDNAQLISLYSNAYKSFGNEDYRKVVFETFEFLQNELQSSNGGFYSAIDADSEGEEGLFYTWSDSEIGDILEEDKNLFSIVYGVSAAGNLKGRSVLRKCANIREASCVLTLDVEVAKSRLEIAKAKLTKARSKRVRPITDDKHITAWNALAVSALVDAYVAFSDEKFLHEAKRTIQFIEENLFLNGQLHRIMCKGKVSIPAFLDDYAFLMEAYIGLYKVTLNETYLNKANKLALVVLESFFNSETGMFFFSSSDHSYLVVRKMELTDGVIPSSSAVMADNMRTLGHYFRNEEYIEISKQMLRNVIAQFNGSGPYVSRWAQLFLKEFFGPAEVGFPFESSAGESLSILQKSWFPNIIPYNSSENSQLPIATHLVENNEIKICFGKECRRPVNTVTEVIDILQNYTSELIKRAD
jgi:uncharacterized protein YyaL (SSP411 family)